MEELKLQLGDRMPSALGIAAKSMNMTSGAFIELVSSGKLASEEFMPKFAEELRRMAREGGALDAALNSSRKQMDRFGTAFQVNVGTMFEEGMESGLASFFRDLTEVMEDMAPTFKVVGRVVGGFFEIVGIGIRMVHQLLRPFMAVVESVTDSTTLLGGAVNGAAEGFKFLAGMILLPFGVLERLNDYVQTTTGGMKDLYSILMLIANGAIIAVVARMLGLTKGIGAMVSGFKGLVGVIRSLLIPAFNILNMHPIIRTITLLTTGLFALKGAYDYFTEDSAANAVSAATAGTTYKYNTVTVQVDGGNQEQVEQAIDLALNRELSEGWLSL